MRSNFSRFLSNLVALVFTACAGTSTRNQNANISSSPALPPSAYESTRYSPMPRPEQCPANDKSWRKENLKILTTLAGDCARLAKYERVEQIGNLIAQLHHQTPWGPFFLSLAAEGRKEYARALWMIDLAIKKSPRTALLHYQKGRIHWQLAEYPQAVENYNIAVKENPKFADPRLFLAQLAFRDHDFKTAHQHFSAVIDFDSDHIGAVVGLAETKMAMSDAKGAIELYERAVNLSPRNLGYRFKLAELYEKGPKDYARALAIYKRLQSMTSESRKPAEEIPFDLNEKIKSLEKIVSQADESAKKVTKSDPSQKKKVSQ